MEITLRAEKIVTDVLLLGGTLAFMEREETAKENLPVLGDSEKTLLTALVWHVLPRVALWLYPFLEDVVLSGEGESDGSVKLLFNREMKAKAVIDNLLDGIVARLVLGELFAERSPLLASRYIDEAETMKVRVADMFGRVVPAGLRLTPHF